MSGQGSVLRVGFFLDGYTLRKVNEYYLSIIGIMPVWISRLSRLG